MTSDGIRYVDEVSVRVLGSTTLPSVRIAPISGSFVVQSENGSYSRRTGREVVITAIGNQVEISIDGRNERLASIRFLPEAGSALYLKTHNSNHSYAGELEVQSTSKGLRILNIVPLEDYVASVVGSEYGLDDLEGAKAMAVVARTYALYALENGKELRDHEGFQVYGGLNALLQLQGGLRSRPPDRSLNTKGISLKLFTQLPTVAERPQTRQYGEVNRSPT
jgi:stage II sporulation protein D